VQTLFCERFKNKNITKMNKGEIAAWVLKEVNVNDIENYRDVIDLLENFITDNELVKQNSRLNGVVGSCEKCGMRKHSVLGVVCANDDCKGRE
jgi:hypothetical protein